MISFHRNEYFFSFRPPILGLESLAVDSELDWIYGTYSVSLGTVVAMSAKPCDCCDYLILWCILDKIPLIYQNINNHLMNEQIS